MSAKHNRNGVVTVTIWNLIDPIGMCKITEPMDAVLPILKFKLADLAVFLIG